MGTFSLRIRKNKSSLTLWRYLLWRSIAILELLFTILSISHRDLVIRRLIAGCFKDSSCPVNRSWSSSDATVQRFLMFRSFIALCLYRQWGEMHPQPCVGENRKWRYTVS
ncbi:hypothetical protein BGW36DRAFT_370373 [Talaromyces proteolyticus]|uniref:Uncharacterized protein n=1 Tax=Talaromyces proteolyticus TaxID=1131652 RepID=A0AAD4KYR6_9EURO|nr:uncharacterized protein BGW36DRAFT_370373 [Talaromyces proteolyticus]KAH8704006.1 hypothetical protein BGW36DRAFT_370373 [Talaromyces proteolyticus]